MKVLKTEDLNRILRKNSVTKNIYLGAYPACIYPKTTKKRYAWISNTDTHGEKGKHWVCWFVNDNKICFFDSFGRHPDDLTLPTNFKTYFHKFNVTQFSERRIQKWNSVTCGYFCIHFIYVLSLGLNYETFLNEYSETNRKFNDFFVVDFVNSII